MGTLPHAQDHGHDAPEVAPDSPSPESGPEPQSTLSGLVSGLAHGLRGNPTLGVGLPPVPSPEPSPEPSPVLSPIEGLLPGRNVHLLSGSSGAGKTTLVGWLVSKLLTEDRVFGHLVTKPPFIGYIAGDRELSDAREKFIAAGWADPPCYGLIDDSDRSVGAAIRRLGDRRAGRREVEEVDFPILNRALNYLSDKHFAGNKLPTDSLIIVDGMATIIGVEPAGAYLRNVARPLVLLNRFAREERLTLLLIHHSGKQVADPKARYARPQDRTLGSMALQGFTSTQMFLTEPELTDDPTQGLHELSIRSHKAAVKNVRLRRDESTGLFDWLDRPEPAGLAPAGPPRLVADFTSKGARLILDTLQQLPGKAATKAFLMGATNLSKPYFYKMLANLLSRGDLEEIRIDGEPAVRLHVQLAGVVEIQENEPPGGGISG